MLMIVAFVLILALSFGIVLLFTRPTASDRAIQQRISGIRALETQSGDAELLPELFKDSKLSEIGWLDNLLQGWTLSQKLSLLIIQSGVPWSVQVVLVASLGCAAVAFVGGFLCTGDGLVGSAAALVCGGLPFALLMFKRGRRYRQFEKALPDALDLIVRALRAGHSVSAALEIVSQEAAEPVKSEFGEVYRQQNFGLPQREALLRLTHRVPSPDLKFVVTAMLVQKETGGNLIDILDRTVAVIRERMRIEGEVKIYTAQGRLTGGILSVLPVIMFVLIDIANPGYARILLEDPLGKKLIYAGVGGMVLGAVIIRKIVAVRV